MVALRASGRYGVAPAPGPLECLQDFFNTVSAGRTVRTVDLIATVEDANEWLAVLWAAYSDEPCEPLTEADLEPLRRVRSVLIASVSRGQVPSDVSWPAPSIRVDLVPGEDGIRLRPSGKGWKRVASLLLSCLHDAEVAGCARRLKVCPNEWCHVAFYDRSKNNSAVWHDQASCGNIAKVRASRARKRAELASPSAD
ncbi:CGNR zinc finger domain-containing protein [Streptomyces sp. NPDC090493]|uniref:CGNR zinc finger domain-containing protein n=1 Tax=Streptomyces sp. NPDC090493 TaxID=3365964 RepID=UPI0037FB0C5A